MLEPKWLRIGPSEIYTTFGFPPSCCKPPAPLESSGERVSLRRFGYSRRSMGEELGSVQGCHPLTSLIDRRRGLDTNTNNNTNPGMADGVLSTMASVSWMHAVQIFRVFLRRLKRTNVQWPIRHCRASLLPTPRPWPGRSSLSSIIPKIQIMVYQMWGGVGAQKTERKPNGQVDEIRISFNLVVMAAVADIQTHRLCVLF